MLRIARHYPIFHKGCRHCGQDAELWAVEFDGEGLKGFCADCVERLGLTVRTWAHQRKRKSL